ncbi:MAG: M28 family peptidase [Candidatus Aminicenantes bacterium]|nr:M28 family peptidase [Candidatus Aminicenantes bacterium]
MIRKLWLIVFVLSVAFQVSQGYAEEKYLQHELTVDIKPDEQFIHVRDIIRFPTNPFPQGNEEIQFLLHGNLNIVYHSKHIGIKKESGEPEPSFFGINTPGFSFDAKAPAPLNRYSIRLVRKLTPQKPNEPKRDFIITLEYEGIIYHPVESTGSSYARGFGETPGIISGQGVYLSGASYWVPWFNDRPVASRMDTRIPGNWQTVSQGRRFFHTDSSGSLTRWESPEPMDEIYLVAARFKEYDLKVGKIDVMAFLCTEGEDEGLANKYLETTGQYLEMYERLIGPYPYTKFALVENFWETGFGMPSFTLLGPQVIRFPFILHSSYPHELLHNWWGNGVLVDYNSGNWCEGLTVYLADYLIKEQRGQGEEYRKTTLQDYTHYAAAKKEEFPLTRFKARYDSLSSSIGYGKSMMLFHMLRRWVGDALFKKAIQRFYLENKFKRATYNDIKKSFETTAGKNFDFETFFRQWTTRTGAPEIRISDATVTPKENSYLLRFVLEQVQQPQEEPYVLNVPAAFYLEGEKAAVVKILETNERRRTFEFSFDRRPLGVDVDPQFDVFRKLHETEIPAVLSNAFGAEAALILLPSRAPLEFLNGYRELAETWARENVNTGEDSGGGGGGKIEIKLDSETPALPDNKAVWLLGRDNLHSGAIQKGISAYNAELNKDFMIIDRKKLLFNANSIIAAVKNPQNPSLVVVLLAADRPAALPGLGRKLPHYGKYSYLAFEGDEPVNSMKGEWPALNSPLSVSLDPVYSLSDLKQTPAQREPLDRLAPLFSAQRMMDYTRFLASAELQGRELGSPGLEKAGQYIADIFRNAGLEPAGENGTYFQTWEAPVGPGQERATLRNVLGMIRGKTPGLQEQAVVLCAHYDHLGNSYPGADDNASGVAVMLELAQALGKNLKPERSLLFIGFTGEESGLLGSAYFVEQLKNGSLPLFKTVSAAVNLDTVGRLKEGDKLMVIGGSSAREWKFIFMGIGYTVGIEAQLLTQELDASDQVSFIKAGIPGVQLFSGPHPDYHKPTDMVDKIVPGGLVKVAAATKEAIVYLADRKEPLTFEGVVASSSSATVAPGAPGAPDAPVSTGNRRVGTGMMPDFTFSGKGVKVGMVSPGSPADKAGIQKDDIIIKIDKIEVANLKEYSLFLSGFKPGDTVTMVYLRGEKEYSTKVTLIER